MVRLMYAATGAEVRRVLGAPTRSRLSTRRGRRDWCIVGVLVVVSAQPAGLRADPVPAGSDMFLTVPTASYLEFSATAVPPRIIPGGFFGAGSDAFEGVIYWLGVPLSGTSLNGADTVVERLGAATPLACGGVADVSVQIKGLSLISNGPITVTFGGGATSSQYDVRACLSSLVAQPIGTMSIAHTCPEGGTFHAELPVVPRLTFTKISGTSGLSPLTLDCGDPANAAACDVDPGTAGVQPTIFMTVPDGSWSHTDPGYGVPSSVGGTVDHDCDGATAAIPFAGTSANFFVGVGWVPCAGCLTTGVATPTKTLTEEQALYAAHGITDIQPQANCCFTTDVDGDGDIDCLNVPTEEHCAGEAGVGLFFPTDVCLPAPGHAPKFGDWCVPKNQTNPFRDCPADPPPTVPEDCFVWFCPPSSAPLAATGVTGGGAQAISPRNRFLSFSGGDPGRNQAIRVKFRTLPPPWNVWDGTTAWVQSPVDVCETSAIGPGGPCGPGVPTFKWARLNCSLPHYRQWALDGIINVSHPGIVPLGVYDIQVIDETCAPNNELAFSPALVMTNSRWGDTVGPFRPASNAWTIPDNTVSITADITAGLNKFGNRPGSPTKVRVDLEPCQVDLKVNITDVTRVLDGFRGFSFPFSPTGGFGCNNTDPCVYTAEAGEVPASKAAPPPK